MPCNIYFHTDEPIRSTVELSREAEYAVLQLFVDENSLKLYVNGPTALMRLEDLGYAIINHCRTLQGGTPIIIADETTGNSASHDLGKPVG